MKNILITGASHGIGRAIAIHFAKNGYNVIANYNKSENEAFMLKNELSSLGYSCHVVKANVANHDEVKMMFEFIISNFGQLDALVNNAGISIEKPFLDVTYDDWNETISTNLNGTFYCCKEALNDMIKRHQGAIVNISSIWGQCGASCEVPYSVSKAGVIGLTKSLAQEFGPSNIRINCVAPGFIDTKMNSNLSTEEVKTFTEDIPLMRIGTPEDVAKAVYFLISDDSKYITGHVLSVNGGYLI